ncbi:hypothetical protein NEMBOFW57_003995 [Staphylotrichum longicolle]|uniref:Uncharacterized protein n=1 Tax=Staphylotrichum longicolle TaxID=669026 RepID=A0AAD4F742_9PEZI|nr:hypothetical protein NEMBOFW57_003995 [Staphylotrichum longicolle]
MCTTGYNRFTCGCALPNPLTFHPCEYAKLKGVACPNFQISEDASRSWTYTIMTCWQYYRLIVFGDPPSWGQEDDEQDFGDEGVDSEGEY